MTYTGRCACGAVTAIITGEPVGVRQCWCRQCQQAAAGGPTNNAMFLTADIEMTGELGRFQTPAASGNTLNQYFCPECGTHVYGQSSARTHMKSIRLGFLDKDHGLKPDMIIWTADAPDWAVLDPALEQVARQPAPPPTPES